MKVVDSATIRARVVRMEKLSVGQGVYNDRALPTTGPDPGQRRRCFSFNRIIAYPVVMARPALGFNSISLAREFARRHPVGGLERGRRDAGQWRNREQAPQLTWSADQDVHPFLTEQRRQRLGFD